MKSLLYILLFCLGYSDVFSQQLNITSWTYPFQASFDFFLDDNDNLVFQNGNGIFIYDDSILIQQVSTTNKPVAKGRFGNILYSDGYYGIVSWTPSGSYTFPGDSSFRLSFSKSMLQLSDGRILSENGAGDGFAILDSTGIISLPVANGVRGIENPMIEINPDLYLFGYDGFRWCDSIAYLNRTSNSITVHASSSLVGNQYILGFDKGAGNKIFMHYQDGIVEVENNAVQNIEYFASSGISIGFFSQETAFTSVPSNKYVLMTKDYFIIYDSGNITYFDSTNGWNIGTGLYLYGGAASDGTVYLAQNNTMYKITSPLLTGIGPQINSKETLFYPNPSNGHLNISANYNSEDQNITLFDLQGQIVFERKLKASSQRIQLPECIPDGIYILKLSDLNNGQLVQSKLILERD